MRISTNIRDQHSENETSFTCAFLGGVTNDTGEFQTGLCSDCNGQTQLEKTYLVSGRVSISSVLFDSIEKREESKNLAFTSLGRELRRALLWRISIVRTRRFHVSGLPFDTIAQDDVCILLDW